MVLGSMFRAEARSPKFQKHHEVVVSRNIVSNQVITILRADADLLSRTLQ